MSDFLLSTDRQPQGRLSDIVAGIYHLEAPRVTEFHGAWGSMAVSDAPYEGFAPIETDRFVFVILGGPVLTFTGAVPDHESKSSNRSRLVLERMSSPGGISWDQDLSGPFVVLKIDKLKPEFEVITDVMSFIPVFEAGTPSGRVLGTHVDMVSRGSNSAQLDPVSLADFIWNGRVTYPHTAYSNIFQLPPASSIVFSAKGDRDKSNTYWQPLEKNPYSSVNDAAEDLRTGIQSYINQACADVDQIAVFLSGGEDSRTVLGMLPEQCRRQAFIFLDRMNREGRVAQAAASRYGAAFKFETRSPEHYLTVMPACADLIGLGSEYIHVHTLGLEATKELATYKRVFGGFLSDTFLKGHHVKKDPKFDKFPYYEQRKINRYSHELPDPELVGDSTVESLRGRIDTHAKAVKALRKESAEEWFNVWPMSMHRDQPNLYGNRRLFSSYEPFMCTPCVKVAAAVPQDWKLNRQLFHKMAKPVLYKSRHLLHADGWLPYQSWQINRFVRPVVGLSRRVQTRTGLSTGNQGPWHDWQELSQTQLWKDLEKTALNKSSTVSEISRLPVDRLLAGDRLSLRRRVLVFQVVYQVERMNSLRSLPKRG